MMMRSHDSVSGKRGIHDNVSPPLTYGISLCRLMHVTHRMPICKQHITHVALLVLMHAHVFIHHFVFCLYT